MTVHSAMEGARVPVAVSELHGGICGSLCVGGVAAVPAWVEECLGDGDPMEEALEAARQQLRELELYSWRSLSASGLEFYPLLPDDDQMFQRRTFVPHSLHFFRMLGCHYDYFCTGAIDPIFDIMCC